MYKLLTDLSKLDNLEMAATQEAIIEKVQLDGNYEDLIGQKDTLVRYAKHPKVEVRKIAMWGLGRCEDLDLAKVLLDGLADPDLDVRIEARNALCVLSRKPNGFGHPADPHAGLDPRATKEEKVKAAEQWSAKVAADWARWYLRVRPYAERNDLYELRARAAANSTTAGSR